MSSRPMLAPFPVITDGDMTTTITSAIVNSRTPLYRGGPKKLDRKERINSDIKQIKISE